MEIIVSIQARLILEITLIVRKIVERKAFLANPKHQYRVSQYGEHDCSPITKKMQIIMSIQVFSFNERT